MTTAKTISATGSRAPDAFPDPPERTPEEMTSFNHLTATGNAYHLIQHFGNPDTTLVAGEHYVSPVTVRRLPGRSMAGLRYPDLLVAFNVDPEAYYRSNAYIISEQGKPPDFVLEIASPRTGRMDVTEKRRNYAQLGIGEYWRFDETGEHHGSRLGGDCLVGGRYEPIEIVELSDGRMEGYSAALNLYLRWSDRKLEWIDPASGRHILTYEDHRDAWLQEREAYLQEHEAYLQERDARLQERNARLQERDARLQEREARLQAEDRLREMEAELRRMRGE